MDGAEMQQIEETKQESELEKSAAESLVLTDSPETIPKKKQHADDVWMMQCIFCILLLLSIFVLHWIRADFSASLQQMYVQHVQEPAPAWLANWIQQIEQWIKQA